VTDHVVVGDRVLLDISFRAAQARLRILARDGVLLGLFASPISGASMNPARTLGPDIVGNDYTGWWVYIAGPVIGAAIAVMIIGAVRGLPDKEERDAAQGGALPVTAAPAADGH